MLFIAANEAVVAMCFGKTKVLGNFEDYKLFDTFHTERSLHLTAFCFCDHEKVEDGFAHQRMPLNSEAWFPDFVSNNLCELPHDLDFNECGKFFEYLLCTAKVYNRFSRLVETQLPSSKLDAWKAIPQLRFENISTIPPKIENVEFFIAHNAQLVELQGCLGACDVVPLELFQTCKTITLGGYPICRLIIGMPTDARHGWLTATIDVSDISVLEQVMEDNKYIFVQGIDWIIACSTNLKWLNIAFVKKLTNGIQMSRTLEFSVLTNCLRRWMKGVDDPSVPEFVAQIPMTPTAKLDVGKVGKVDCWLAVFHMPYMHAKIYLQTTHSKTSLSGVALHNAFLELLK